MLQSVPEIVEPFVPLPDDLMVNLKESRSVIDSLLDSLPTAFGRTGTVSVQLACLPYQEPVRNAGADSS